MMLSGKQTQEEMIKAVDKGIFAVSFGGGQVDITSGKFVFNCTEAYEIVNGKIGSPIKGATLDWRWSFNFKRSFYGRQ